MSAAQTHEGEHAAPHAVDPAINLVRMANQIGEYFGAFPDRVEAVEGITQHLRKFWAPRMRRQFYQHLDRAGDDSGLLPIVREAALQHRAELEPPLA